MMTIILAISTIQAEIHVVTAEVDLINLAISPLQAQILAATAEVDRVILTISNLKADILAATAEVDRAGLMSLGAIVSGKVEKSQDFHVVEIRVYFYWNNGLQLP